MIKNIKIKIKKNLEIFCLISVLLITVSKIRSIRELISKFFFNLYFKFLIFFIKMTSIISLAGHKNQKKPIKISIFWIFFYSIMLDFL